MSIAPKTKNFQKNGVKLRFIDSFKFLNANLDKLASYLDKDKLKIVRSEFCKLSAKDFNFLTRKGIFPYKYIDCVEKLQDTRLLLRELFFSSLTGDTISESNYCDYSDSRRERMAAILHLNARRVQWFILENWCLVISRHFRKFP